MESILWQLQMLLLDLEFYKLVLEIYEKYFEENNYKYITGNEYSIADIPYIPYINCLLKCGSEYKTFLKNYPLMYKWLKRIFNRQAVKNVID